MKRYKEQKLRNVNQKTISQYSSRILQRLDKQWATKWSVCCINKLCQNRPSFSVWSMTSITIFFYNSCVTPHRISWFPGWSETLNPRQIGSLPFIFSLYSGIGIVNDIQELLNILCCRQCFIVFWASHFLLIITYYFNSLPHNLFNIVFSCLWRARFISRAVPRKKRSITSDAFIPDIPVLSYLLLELSMVVASTTTG